MKVLQSFKCGLALGLFAFFAASGCGSKAGSTPNPDFTVPDVPPGKRTMPGEGGKKEKTTSGDPIKG